MFPVVRWAQGFGDVSMPFSKEELVRRELGDKEAGTVPAVAHRHSQGPNADLSSIIKYVPHCIRHTKSKLEHVIAFVTGVMQAPGVRAIGLRVFCRGFDTVSDE
jgi:hypothetical protein